MTEYVVLCTPDGEPVGTQPKSEVHHQDTPLHLAFSCYLFDTEGRFLVTVRARHKRTWPGVRTNSCCGHPAPGESMTKAIARRLEQELGVRARDVMLRLPRFAYRAEMADGTVENELCPVYSAIAEDTGLTPDPEEVDDALWVPWADYVAEALNDPDSISPWSALQVAELNRLGPDPLSWPAGTVADLPAAASV